MKVACGSKLPIRGITGFTRKLLFMFWIGRWTPMRSRHTEIQLQNQHNTWLYLEFLAFIIRCYFNFNF